MGKLKGKVDSIDAGVKGSQGEPRYGIPALNPPVRQGSGLILPVPYPVASLQEQPNFGNVFSAGIGHFKRECPDMNSGIRPDQMTKG